MNDASNPRNLAPDERRLFDVGDIVSIVGAGALAGRVGAIASHSFDGTRWTYTVQLAFAPPAEVVTLTEQQLKRQVAPLRGDSGARYPKGGQSRP